MYTIGYLNAASGAVAILAAALWLKGSTIKTPKKLTAIIVDDEDGFQGELPELFRAVSLQSNWNAAAAIAAAFSALLQGLAAFLTL